MAPFKDEHIMIIVPGSETTVAQLGLPESFTPARLRVRSRMFPAEKEGEWEPYKVRRKEGVQPAERKESHGGDGDGDDDVLYEEDRVSEEGAVWPIVEGKIVNWSCFFALISHVHNLVNPPLHTPILLVTQPAWTPREHERLTQFFFEKFKTPAFALMDAALATSWAYGVHTATIVDVGKDKVDVTAISEFIPHTQGRIVSLPGCGGEAFTQGLLAKLKSQGFNREMCEQLKKNPICEILPTGTPLPGAGGLGGKDAIANPAAAASTGAPGSGPAAAAAAAIGNVPRGPGVDTDVGDEIAEEKEGVLDVASIVAGGHMTEYLAKKEREKQEKASAKKKGADAASSAARPVKLPNSRREKATFMFEDHALLDTLKGMNLGSKGLGEAQAALDEGPQRRGQDDAGDADPGSAVDANGATGPGSSNSRSGPIRREIEVGTERFQAASGGVLEKIADAIHRCISSVDEVNKRSELWDAMIVCGNGAKVRGFKEALLTTIQSNYVISPSSATIFTSEIPSNISTPTGTGANTPQPQLGPHGGPSGVNPLLLAATTAQHPHLQPQTSNPLMMSGMPSHNTHSSHGQTPSSVKFVKPPEYFPEWKDVGFDESPFLGAQVAAKVIFIVDQGQSKGYMSRPDYNDQGPPGIHDYSL